MCGCVQRALTEQEDVNLSIKKDVASAREDAAVMRREIAPLQELSKSFTQLLYQEFFKRTDRVVNIDLYYTS